MPTTAVYTSSFTILMNIIITPDCQTALLVSKLNDFIRNFFITEECF